MEMTTLQKLWQSSIERLRDAQTETATLDVAVILMHFLNIERLGLMMSKDMPIDQDVQEQIEEAVSERIQGKPIAYIVGRQEFMGIDFSIAEGVLIPRCDTEIVVEKAIELLKNVDNPVIIDMCAGSGAIAISIASFIKKAVVYACDISDIAISCSKKNVFEHDLEERVHIIKSDLFTDITDIKADMIISNPPYIETATINSLMPGVSDYEPHLALDGGVDGLDFYKKITRDAKAYLKPEGILIYEIGYNQGEALKNIMQENNYENVQVKRDLAGLDRCVYAKLKAKE